MSTVCSILETWAMTFRKCGRTIRCAGVFAIGLSVLGLAALTGLRFWVDTTYSARIYDDVQLVPPRPVAIVFGAGITASGRLSPILADRVNTALRLYQAGRVNKLLLTGDNRFTNYNEPGSMAAYLRERAMPEADMVLDYAGRRTYDSCYRARYIFGVQRAVLVTQNYHLDRALFTCESLGIDAVGLAANGRRPSFFYWLREMPATAVAWFDVNIRHPMPVMGDAISVDWGPDHK
jgi:SanA protein